MTCRRCQELVQLVRVGRQETKICFWGAVRLLPPVLWYCRRNPYIITLRVILKLGEIMYLSWALCLGFIISCGSWWAGSTWTDTRDGVPSPASLTVLPPLLWGRISNGNLYLGTREWKYSCDTFRMNKHVSHVIPQDTCPCCISCNKVLTVILFS